MQPDAHVALRFLLIGATLLAVGIGTAATGQGSLGSFVIVLGAALMVAGLHTYGRAGPDKGIPPQTRKS
jgi:hypothetical protein